MSRMPGKRREGLILMPADPNAGQGADRLYRALVETSTDVIALIGIDGRIRFINYACREVLGFEPEEMVGGHVRAFNANRELPGADVAFEQILRGESRSRRRMTARRKDGGKVELMFNASPLRSDDGRVIGVVVIATDIGDLIAIQQRLEQAESRYRSLVEQLPAVSYIAEPGPDGTWNYVS